MIDVTLVVQVVMAFGVLTGVCMTILFRGGFDNKEYILSAIQMVTGVGFCVGAAKAGDVVVGAAKAAKAGRRPAGFPKNAAAFQAAFAAFAAPTYFSAVSIGGAVRG